MKRKIQIPNYRLSEEIINSISHGIGAVLSIVAFLLLLVKAISTQRPLAVVSSVIFGISMILLYTFSCIYHSLSKNISGKGVLRVLDHCNVYLLVFGTYFPLSLLGVGGGLGVFLLCVVGLFSFVGIFLTIIDIKKYQLLSVLCHLICGWSIVFGISSLLYHISFYGVVFLLLGGLFYTIGAILFGIGSKVPYIHCVFHVFCLLGTFSHFYCVYFYVL